jgi:16S rRNA (uracil1498-N3)-methyltransferase
VSGRVRVAITDLEAGARTLPDPISHHLASVLRLRAGDAFVAFDPRLGVEAEGEILSVHHGSVRAALGPPRPAVRIASRDLTWIQGLAKGDKMDSIVRDATELGATRVLPVVTAFSVVQLDGPRAAARMTRWARIAEEAARQCGRADPPVVEPPRSWAEAVAGAGAAARFCLHERAKDPLGPGLARALAAGSSLAFAAGPEGGLSEAEVAGAAAGGFEVVSLGPFVLRAETVATAVLGAVRVLLADSAR